MGVVIPTTEASIDVELNHNAAKERRFRPDFVKCMRNLCMQMLILTMVSHPCNAQASTPTAAPVSALSPAPTPSPPFVNVTQILVLAGDYTTFVNLMIETKVDEVFQNDANQTQVGITIFAPTDEAFSSKPASTLLKNITEQQKVSLVEYHALNDWVSLGSLQRANQNLTTTLATYNNGGGRYQLNLTNTFGVVQVLSGWTKANLTSTLYSQVPVSIFAIDEVLLPDDIFGLPSPAPAPSPTSGAPTPSPSSSSSSASGLSGGHDSSFAPRSLAPPLSSLFISLLLFRLFL